MEWAAYIEMTSVCGSVCSTRGFVQSETLGILQSDFFMVGGGGGRRGSYSFLGFFGVVFPDAGHPTATAQLARLFLYY